MPRTYCCLYLIFPASKGTTTLDKSTHSATQEHSFGYWNANFVFLKVFFLLFLERWGWEKGKERNIGVRQKHGSAASHM